MRPDTKGMLHMPVCRSAVVLVLAIGSNLTYALAQTPAPGEVFFSKGSDDHSLVISPNGQTVPLPPGTVTEFEGGRAAASVKITRGQIAYQLKIKTTTELNPDCAPTGGAYQPTSKLLNSSWWWKVYATGKATDAVYACTQLRRGTTLSLIIYPDDQGAFDREGVSAFATALPANIFPAPREVWIGVTGDQKGIVFDPPGKSVPAPPGTAKFDTPEFGNVKWVYVEDGRYVYHMAVDADRNEDCAGYHARNRSPNDVFGKAKTYLGVAKQQSTDNPFYDSRWESTYYSSQSSMDKNTVVDCLCLQGPSTSVKLQIEYKAGTDFNHEAVLAFTKAIADTLGPGTTMPPGTPLKDAAHAKLVEQRQAAARLAAANPPPPPPPSIQNVFPRQIIEAAAICKQGGGSNRERLNAEINCELLKAFQRVHRLCASGTNGRGMPRSCNSIADDAAKDKDYKAAAVYYQHACMLGDKKSCGRAEDNKKKAGL